MSTVHKIKRNDCVASIAAELGFHPDTVWYSPENQQLRRLRGDGRILKKWDRLLIPEKTLHHETAKTEDTHRFRRLGLLDTLHLAIVDSKGEARPDARYTLQIGHQTIEGKTNEDGDLVETIPANCQDPILLFVEGQDAKDDEDYEPDLECEIDVRALDPADDDSGLLMRLQNLGYQVDLDPDAFTDPELGIYQFQSDAGITETGELDEATKDKLRELYDC